MSKHLVQIALILMPLTGVISQSVLSNAGNFDDAKTLFVNPAAGSFLQNPRFAVGNEFYYPSIGAYSLNNSLFTGILPVDKIGAIGFNAQYFSSGLFNKGYFYFNYSRAIIASFFHVGISFGVLNYSYNQDKFDLVDLGDPVFSNGYSKNMLSFGFGIASNPWEDLYLGIAAQHINQPNASLAQSTSKIPMNIYTGLKYKMTIFTPLLSFNYIENKPLFALGLQRWFLNEQLLLRCNGDSGSLGLEVGFRINFPAYWMQLQYNYMYPLSELHVVSNDFHQVLLTWNAKEKSVNCDFKLSVLPEEQVVKIGQTVVYSVSIEKDKRCKNSISLRVSSEIHKPDMILVPSLVADDDVSSLSVTTDKGWTEGVYKLKVEGQSDEFHQEATCLLKVVRPELFCTITKTVDTLLIYKNIKVKSRNPLVPNIYFEENSTTISSERYELINPDSDPTKRTIFFSDSLREFDAKYENTLNIISQRLGKNQDMIIDIWGYNSDWGSEKDNIGLSNARAQAVKDYFLLNPKVKSEQIRIHAGLLPPDPASSKNPLGREENQRVEISTLLESSRILEPLENSGVEITSSDSFCVFRIDDFIAEAGLEKWQLTIIESNQNAFMTFYGDNTIPDSIIWDWKNNKHQDVNSDKIYSYRMCLYDSVGQIFCTESSAWTIIEQIDRNEQKVREESRHRLILFKYDRSEIDTTSKILLNELEYIVDELDQDTTSWLEINGHTDIIGTHAYNCELSKRRAKTVYDFFVGKGIDPARITYNGFCEDIPLMSNDIPEGRMINRRVELVIKKISIL